jgi:large subunit ribosomal protein L3
MDQQENKEGTAAAAEEQTSATSASSAEVKLTGLLGFKLGMTSVYDDNGVYTPVTALKIEPLVVSQVKTKEKEGYEAIQVATKAQKAGRLAKANVNHFKKSGFENGARITREIRQKLPQGVAVGQKVTIDSLVTGDFVSVTAISKGRGFTGVQKRHNFAGGPASHGSGFHRRPGSVGNRTEPGRVMPGRKLPGHYGSESTTVKNLRVIDIDLENQVVLVKGGVPGHRNTLVRIEKV